MRLPLTLWQMGTLAIGVIAVTALVAGFLRSEPVPVVQPVPTLRFPTLTVPGEAPAPTPELKTVTVEVRETFTAYKDYLLTEWETQQGDVADIRDVAELNEGARGLFIPTFENPISPGFSTEDVATRYISRALFELVLAQAGWPEDLWDKAWLVSRCEARAEYSRGPEGFLDRLAVGPGFERGIFQIHAMYFNPESAAFAGMTRPLFADFDLWDPLQNAMAALFLYEHGGWSHWECHNQGLAG